MTEQSISAQADETAKSPMSRTQLVLMVAALAASVLSYQLNATMVAPALRAINTQFGSDAYVTTSTYFYLAGAVANVVLVRWSDYIGRKRVLLGILVVLCTGTVLCIVAQSLPLFAIGRFLQGAANITFALSFLISQQHLSAKAFGISCGVLSSLNGGVAGGDAFLSGVMVDHLGYRSVFVLLLGLGLLGLAAAWRAVPADSADERQPGRMDWAGAALISLTVGGINLFFSSGATHGWTSPPALAWIIGSVVAFVGLLLVDTRKKDPLVAFTHMRTREAWPMVLVTILITGSFVVVLAFIVPALAEDPDSGFGLTATMTALLFLTPAAITQVVAAPFMGRLAVHVGFVTLLRAGLAASIAVTALLAVFAQDKHVFIGLMIVFGLVFGAAVLTAMNTLAITQASDDEPGALPGICNASYGIGASLGFAFVGPIVGSGTHASFQHAIWLCIAIGFAALVVSIILKPKPGPITKVGAAA